MLANTVARNQTESANRTWWQIGGKSRAGSTTEYLQEWSL